MKILTFLSSLYTHPKNVFMYKKKIQMQTVVMLEVVTQSLEPEAHN